MVSLLIYATSNGIMRKKDQNNDPAKNTFAFLCSTRLFPPYIQDQEMVVVVMVVMTMTTITAPITTVREVYTLFQQKKIQSQVLEVFQCKAIAYHSTDNSCLLSVAGVAVVAVAVVVLLLLLLSISSCCTGAVPEDEEEEGDAMYRAMYP
jgi:hypothetical protein